MAKIQIEPSRYTFNKTAKTITFLDYTSLDLCNILFINNATAGIDIYDFSDAAKNGTISGNVLTLDYDTSSMNNADSLIVFIEDPAFDQKTTIPKDTARALNVRGVSQKIDRIGFTKTISNNVDSEFLQLITTGSGQTVNQTGGNLVITSGTTARSETIIRSNASWEGGIRLRQKTILSQRIANQNFFVELVDVIGDGLAYNITSVTTCVVTIPSNPFTAQNVGQGMFLGGFSGTGTFLGGRYVIASVSGNDVTFTVSGFATGTGTVSVFGWNHYHMLYDGTNGSQVKFQTQRNGWTNGAVTSSVNSTLGVGHMAFITANDMNATFSDQLVTSVAGTIQMNSRATQNENVPDDIPLRLQLRVQNLGTAPSSTTTWTIGMVSMSNFSATDVSIQDVRHSSPQSALPVELVKSITSFISGSVTAMPLIPITANTGDTGAKTATFNGVSILQTAWKGVQLVLKVGAVSGTTPTMVAKVQGSADGGTTWYDIPGANTATLTATGDYGITIYNGIKEVAPVATTGTTAQVNAVIPRNWRVVYTIGGTTPSFTLTNVHFTYLP